ncbi:Glycosyl transferase, family 2 [Raphidiopsis brookii D9]|nr:Glycosyl transferase, family 2 [Raphidiopsis brookii D9]
MNCFNGEEYLKEAIESVLNQTYKNWELIFWDNQSTDGSERILKSYNSNKLKYFYSSKHTPLYEARNFALENAMGEFIAFLDVDDWWEQDKLEKQIPLFNDPEVGLVYGNFWIENQKKGRKKIAFKMPLPRGNIQNDLLESYTVGILTIVIRKQTLDTLPYIFDKRFNYIGDYDLVIRLASKCKIDCVQEPVAHYRKTGTNLSVTKTDLNISEMQLWLKEALDKSDIVPISMHSRVSFSILRGQVNLMFQGKRIIEGLIILLASFLKFPRIFLLLFCRKFLGMVVDSCKSLLVKDLP